MKKQQQSQLSTADRRQDHPPQQIQDSLLSQYQFGFQVPTNFILDLFQQVATTLGFQMIQKQASHATAIKQAKKTLLQMIDCFSLISQANMTAIKLTIQTNEKISKRVCKVRGLVGSKKQVKQFMSVFKQRSKQLIKIQNSFYPDQQEQDQQNLQNPFHLQACAIYMFHKILSNEQYSIGSILKASISNYRQKFSSIQIASKQIPLPMRQIIIIIQQIIDELYKDFNYGKKQMQKVMPYCRVSVQRYVFGQVENIIIPIYEFGWSQVDNVIQQKRNKIFNTKSLTLILDQIGLPKPLWFIKFNNNNNINNNNNNQNNNTPNNTQNYSNNSNNKQNSLLKITQQIRSIKQWKQIIKYSKASQQLQKLVFAKTPRQKLKQCQISYTTLKTLFYQYTNKLKQLTNMEEIIPILILVILLTQLPNLKAQLQLILDWIEADPAQMDAQKRLIINLTESMNFIYRDWKI